MFNLVCFNLLNPWFNFDVQLIKTDCFISIDCIHQWVIPIAGSATMVFIDIAQNEPCFPSPCELVFIASIWACHACANLGLLFRYLLNENKNKKRNGNANEHEYFFYFSYRESCPLRSHFFAAFKSSCYSLHCAFGIKIHCFSIRKWIKLFRINSELDSLLINR